MARGNWRDAFFFWVRFQAIRQAWDRAPEPMRKWITAVMGALIGGPVNGVIAGYQGFWEASWLLAFYMTILGIFGMAGLFVLARDTYRALRIPIEIIFDPDAPGFNVRTPLGDARFHAKYVRVRVKNRGRRPLKNCRIFLLEIHALDDTKLYPTEFCDPAQLRWAGTGSTGRGFVAAELIPEIPKFVDVVHANEHEDELIPDVEVLLNRYQGFFWRLARYQFTLRASADDIYPTDFKFIINWTRGYVGLTGEKSP